MSEPAVEVKIQILDPEIPLPKPSYPGDVAVDLHSRVDAEIPPLGIQGIPTGVAIELPHGYEGQIRPRSGLALKNGISIVNTPGTVDTQYRGEIVAILINLGKIPFTVKKGDRICQLAVRPVPSVVFTRTEKLSDTERGKRGFGSSGKQ